MNNFLPYFLTLNEQNKRQVIESIIFSSDSIITSENLFEIIFEKDLYEKNFNHNEKLKFIEFSSIIFENFSWSLKHLEDIILSINNELEVENRPYRIINFAGGYQFSTKKEFGELTARFINSKNKKRLTQAGLESLAIIAYKQPISKPGIEEIRGVNSNEVVNSLLEKSLIKIVGRGEGIGKSLLYGTTEEFLKLFGLKSLNDLPQLKELEEITIEENSKDSILIEVPFDTLIEAEPENENEE